MTDKPHHPLNVDGEQRAFFGRRSGKRLHKGQDRLFKDLLPELAIELGDGPLDPGALFADKSAYVIEIGYGGGEHLSLEAGRNPDTGYIGCEVFSGGIAKLLQQIEEDELENIRLFTDDALKLLAKLPDGSLDGALSALSRPLAEDAPPQAAVYLAGDPGRTGAGAEAGRGVPGRDRHRGLRGLDAGARSARACLPLCAGAAGRLAHAVRGVGADAVRRKGPGRGPVAQLLHELHAGLRTNPTAS